MDAKATRVFSIQLVEMASESTVRKPKEIRDGTGSMSRSGCREEEARPPPLGRQSPRDHHCRPERQQGRWAELPPELLQDVIQRVEATADSWPARRHVVACAAVCRSWREVAKEVVRTPEQCGRITFPISLKQPGPRDTPIRCFIRRERATGTYYLHLGPRPALHGENGKILLSARKIRYVTSIEYVISLVSGDFSKASKNCIGKLRSNFWGTKFTIYDSQPPCDATVRLHGPLSRRLLSKQVSPRIPAGRYEVAAIAYEINVLQIKGPRRMRVTMHSIPSLAIQEGGTAPTPTGFLYPPDEQFSDLSPARPKDRVVGLSSTNPAELPTPATTTSFEPLVLKNKAPRWHQLLQCWCLNFRGRVTVASVKNFQLVAAVDPSNQVSLAEQERVILQFGKIGKDVFTMDYQYPLSAFQAFAISLTSFGTKLACE